MAPRWATFEEKVRGIASQIWNVPAGPETINGTAMDCVLRVNESLTILIEITEERDLDKVRTDVNRIVGARQSLLLSDHIYAVSYCIINAATVTTAMREYGKGLKVKILTLREFQQQFFEFSKYENARKSRQFGSVVDPVTAEIDSLPYVPVKYALFESERVVTVNDIADMLRAGKRIVLIGDYGAGKSRCVRELFFQLSETQATTHTYPIAVDLRRNWGLQRHAEIIRRHFDDMGLDGLASEVLRVLGSGAFIFLLDGFDEIGSQAWSTDADKLKAIRAQSLEGVRDLIQSYKGPILITGRAHYFNSNEELFSALGLASDDTQIIQCKEEFDQNELIEYFKILSKEIELPSWLPRKPLICKTIAALNADEISQMFEEEGGDVEFWHHFIDVLCKRDVRIHASLDSDSLLRVLLVLARVTRSKPADVGPLTLQEIQAAFQEAVGYAPIEQASIMLQRLPGLGRVRAESDDRQFVDSYILDGLRAVDLFEAVTTHPPGIEAGFWRNPLDRLGQRIFCGKVESRIKQAMQLATRCASGKNKILASDVIAAVAWLDEEEYDYRNFALDEGHFLMFDMSCVKMTNLIITNSTFANFVFPTDQPKNIIITDSVIERAYGLTSAAGVPSWAGKCQVLNFESASNISRIRKIGLKLGHEILVTILHKTFFQPGAGRKEEALTRGLGSKSQSSLSGKILAILITHDILIKFKGDEGWVYRPNRAHTGRMAQVVAKLSLCGDEIWQLVGDL